MLNDLRLTLGPHAIQAVGSDLIMECQNDFFLTFGLYNIHCLNSG